MTLRNKILLAIDNPDLRRLVSELLVKHHYNVLVSAENVLQKVFDEVPHLVIVDEDLSQNRGKSVTRSIKQDLILKHIPIVLLVNQPDAYLSDRFTRADIYFQKEPELEKLAEKIHEELTKNYNELDLNPLTHLPGSRSNVLRIERAIHSKKLFGICCIDLSDLASYNSAYGDARGDQIIVKLSQITIAAVKKKGSPDNFVGHFGGDDFIVVTQSGEQAVEVSKEIIQNFDLVIQDYYDTHDREIGYIIQRDEEGVLTKYPLMSVSVVIMENKRLLLTGIGEIGKIANELKKYI